MKKYGLCVNACLLPWLYVEKRSQVALAEECEFSVCITLFYKGLSLDSSEGYLGPQVAQANEREFFLHNIML